MKNSVSRKSFIKSISIAGAGLSLTGSKLFTDLVNTDDLVPIGIIGLDTSHSTAFTKLINNPENGKNTGFKVVAAYPYGSRTIEASYSRIPEYTEQIKEFGVNIVDSIDELLNQVDAVMLLTNDGHPHLEQSLQVMESGKPMFIDKPVAGSLSDIIKIFEASRKMNTSIFSSSSLRYLSEAQAVRHQNKIGDVIGADVFSPAIYEETHPDLFWYGIHGVETLFTVMGTGCKSVSRTSKTGTDIVVGTWEDSRLGTFRGIRDGKGGYGGTAYGSEEILNLGSFEGYGPMIDEVLTFFDTGKTPVSLDETLEIYTFMEAADESKRRNGESVTLKEVLDKVT